MAAPENLKGREFPYWLAALVLLFIVCGWWILRDEVYRPLFDIVVRGLFTTVWVTIVGFFLACVFGLVLALGQDARTRAIRECTRFTVELLRGVPLIVLLFYVAFVATPGLVTAYRMLFAPLIEGGLLPDLQTRDVDLTIRAIAALMLCYGAFIAEVFRAGIQSVSKGQIEAATALGLSRTHIFRLVVFPQALKVALPPLGNDFINMIKDSALVSAIGVSDIAFMGKTVATNNFRYFEAYNIVAFLYLIMTIGLSIGVRRLEKHLKRDERR